MLVLAIVLVFFGLAYLLTWNLCGERFLDGRDRSNAEETAASRTETTDSIEPASHGLRLLPPLPLAYISPEELVCELERAIGDETATISRILRRPAQKDLQHLYRN